jgi:hypothetical protein
MSGAVAIPKRLGHIWIGPKPAPRLWMDSWPKLHPDWSYTVYGNDTLIGYPFRLRRLINEYAWRGAWAGVQDMMRYELLYRYGGFMADADAISLHAVDELLDQPRAYTVFDRPETDKFRGVCPFLACEPGNPFVGAVIDELAKLDPWELRKPEVSTGNRFLMRMIKDRAPGPEVLQIFPTHTFIPWQKSAPNVWYDGPDKIYAEQKWGTSTFAYNRQSGPSAELLTAAEVQARHAGILDRLAGAFGDRQGANLPANAERQAAAKVAGDMLAGMLDQPEVATDFAALNVALCDGMVAAGLPPRFQGAHFFRHMQQQPLTEGKLRTRSDAIRRQILGWLGTARRALVIGYDTGHLILSALHLQPELSICATDAGRWPDEGDEDPPQRARYVPMARDWLAQRFPDRLMIDTQSEGAFLAGLQPTTGPFDLMLFADADIYALRTLMAARPLLADGAMVIAASASGDAGLRFADRLRVQGLCGAAIAATDFGPGKGSLSVLQLD